ncbi:inner membrane transporter RhtA [Streptacidiphilus sp. EB129]
MTTQAQASRMDGGSPRDAGPPSGRRVGMVMMVGSALSNQAGAAVAAVAFPVMGPVGVVAVRQWVAAVALAAAGRPRLRSFTRAQWGPVLALAAVLATMNLSLYTAIDRIGLGLAVTLEFLGPLSVALAASRRAVDLGCGLIAGAAAVALARPQPSTDYLGIGLGLLAAVCWALYILLNRTVGARVPGAQGTAAAAVVSGLLYLPVGLVFFLHRAPSATALAHAAAAGVLSSAVPFLADLLALRRVPARFFGLFMSVNPMLAALAGLVALGQALGWVEWAAIAAIVAANVVSVLAAARHTQSFPDTPRDACTRAGVRSSTASPSPCATPTPQPLPCAPVQPVGVRCQDVDTGGGGGDCRGGARPRGSDAAGGC